MKDQGKGNGYSWEVVSWPEGTRPWRSDPVAFCPDYAHMTEESKVNFLKTMDDVEDRRTAAREKPNPGSKEAESLGCTCPVMDNNHGLGENGQFWISGDCPLHGTPAIPHEPEAT